MRRSPPTRAVHVRGTPARGMGARYVSAVRPRGSRLYPHKGDGMGAYESATPCDIRGLQVGGVGFGRTPLVPLALHTADRNLLDMKINHSKGKQDMRVKGSRIGHCSTCQLRGISETELSGGWGAFSGS